MTIRFSNVEVLDALDPSSFLEQCGGRVLFEVRLREWEEWIGSSKNRQHLGEFWHRGKRNKVVLGEVRSVKRRF